MATELFATISTLGTYKVQVPGADPGVQKDLKVTKLEFLDSQVGLNNPPGYPSDYCCPFCETPVCDEEVYKAWVCSCSKGLKFIKNPIAMVYGNFIKHKPDYVRFPNGTVSSFSIPFATSSSPVLWIAFQLVEPTDLQKEVGYFGIDTPVRNARFLTPYSLKLNSDKNLDPVEDPDGCAMYYRLRRIDTRPLSAESETDVSLINSFLSDYKDTEIAQYPEGAPVPEITCEIQKEGQNFPLGPDWNLFDPSLGNNRRHGFSFAHLTRFQPFAEDPTNPPVMVGLKFHEIFDLEGDDPTKPPRPQNDETWLIEVCLVYKQPKPITFKYICDYMIKGQGDDPPTFHTQDLCDSAQVGTCYGERFAIPFVYKEISEDDSEDPVGFRDGNNDYWVYGQGEVNLGAGGTTYYTLRTRVAKPPFDPELAYFSWPSPKGAYVNLATGYDESLYDNHNYQDWDRHLEVIDARIISEQCYERMLNAPVLGQVSHVSRFLINYDTIEDKARYERPSSPYYPSDFERASTAVPDSVFLIPPRITAYYKVQADKLYHIPFLYKDTPTPEAPIRNCEGIGIFDPTAAYNCITTTINNFTTNIPALKKYRYWDAGTAPDSYYYYVDVPSSGAVLDSFWSVPWQCWSDKNGGHGWDEDNCTREWCTGPFLHGSNINGFTGIYTNVGVPQYGGDAMSYCEPLDPAPPLPGVRESSSTSSESNSSRSTLSSINSTESSESTRTESVSLASYSSNSTSSSNSSSESSLSSISSPSADDLLLPRPNDITFTNLTDPIINDGYQCQEAYLYPDFYTYYSLELNNVFKVGAQFAIRKFRTQSNVNSIATPIDQDGFPLYKYIYNSSWSFLSPDPVYMAAIYGLPPKHTFF